MFVLEELLFFKVGDVYLVCVMQESSLRMTPMRSAATC